MADWLRNSGREFGAGPARVGLIVRGEEDGGGGGGELVRRIRIRPASQTLA